MIGKLTHQWLQKKKKKSIKKTGVEQEQFKCTMFYPQ